MKFLKPKQIIVALDFDSIEETNALVKLLDPKIFRLKIGKQLYASEGPRVLENFNKKGFDIFLDLKLHDIPVEASCYSEASWYLLKLLGNLLDLICLTKFQE